MVCSLLSEWCVATSFYQSSANHVFFYPLFNLRNLLYLIEISMRKHCPQIFPCMPSRVWSSVWFIAKYITQPCIASQIGNVTIRQAVYLYSVHWLPFMQKNKGWEVPTPWFYSPSLIGGGTPDFRSIFVSIFIICLILYPVNRKIIEYNPSV